MSSDKKYFNIELNRLKERFEKYEEVLYNYTLMTDALTKRLELLDGKEAKK